MVAKLCQERLRTGADMNDKLRAHKDFRNPSIYEKLIQFCDIDEFGTNYPPVSLGRTTASTRDGWHQLPAGESGTNNCQYPRRPAPTTRR